MSLLNLKKDSNSLSIIAGNMAKLYNEGIPLLHAFDLIVELPITKDYKESIINVKHLIIKGYSIDKAFSKYKELYPEFFISMLTIAEKSGRLTEVLNELEKYYEKEFLIRKKLKNSLTYPLFLVGLLIILMIFLCVFLIPSFYELYVSMDIPPPRSCNIIYDTVNFIGKHPIEGISYIVLWGIGIPAIALILTIKYIVNKNKVNVSILGTLEEYVTVFILYIIIASGINLTASLSYCIDSMEYRGVRKRLALINSEILSGKSLSEALESNENYSVYTVSLIKLGEEGGNVEERLNTCMKYLEEKSNGGINYILKKLEPAIIVIMGIGVFGFIITFVLPLFNSLMGGLN